MSRIHTALAVLLLLLSSSPLRAETPEHRRARLLFAEGNALTRTGDYVRALDRFRQAYAIVPSPKILLNTGAVLELLGRNAEAADVLARYLADPDADPARRERVAAALAELEARVGHLRFRGEPGAIVRIDGVEVGSLTARVEPGTHVVAAQGVGAAPLLITITVAAGEEREVDLGGSAPASASASAPASAAASASASAPASAAAAAPASASASATGAAAAPASASAAAPAPASALRTDVAPRPPGRGLPLTGLAIASLGVAAIGAGGVFAWRADAARRDVEAAIARGEPWSPELAARDADAHRHGRAAAVALGAGALLSAGGAVLYLRSRGNARRPALQAHAGPGALSLCVEGSF